MKRSRPEDTEHSEYITTREDGSVVCNISKLTSSQASSYYRHRHQTSEANPPTAEDVIRTMPQTVSRLVLSSDHENTTQVLGTILDHLTTSLNLTTIVVAGSYSRQATSILQRWDPTRFPYASDTNERQCNTLKEKIHRRVTINALLAAQPQKISDYFSRNDCRPKTIDQARTTAILTHALPENWTSLTLSDGYLYPDTFKLLISMLSKTRTLISLDISNNKLTHQQLTALLQAVSQNPKSRLTKLNLSGNPLEGETVDSLIEFLKSYARISELVLNRCKLDKVALIKLSGWITHDSMLRRLDISYNSITLAGLNSLAEALHQNRTMTELFFKWHETNRGAYPSTSQNPQLRISDAVAFTDLLKSNSRLLKAEIIVDEIEFEWKYQQQIPKPSPHQRKLKKLLEENGKHVAQAITSLIQDDFSTFKKTVEGTPGVSPYATDEEGETLGHLAVIHNRPRCLDYLKTIGMSFDAINKKGNTIRDLVTELKDENFNQIMENPNAIYTAAVAPPSAGKRRRPAAIHPNQRTIMAFAQPQAKRAAVAPAATTTTASSQVTTMFFAIHNQQQALVEELLPQVDTNAQDRHGDSLAHAAARAQNLPVMQALLDKHINLSLKNIDGQTALHLTCQYIADAELLQRLTDAGATVDDTDEFGATPLFYVCGGFVRQAWDEMQQHIRGHMAHLLLTQGADPNRKIFDYTHTQTNTMPLHHATRCQHYFVVTALLHDARTDVNAQDDQGNTALHIAILTGQLSLIDRLLNQPGITINARNKAGKTADELILEQSDPYLKEQMQQLLKKHEIKTVSQHCGTHWIRSFTLHHGSRRAPMTPTLFEYDNTHQALSSNLGSAGTQGNQVYANVCFVLSDQPHQPGSAHRKQSIEIKLLQSDFGEAVHTSDTTKQAEVIFDEKTLQKRTRYPEAKARILELINAAPQEARDNMTDDTKNFKKPLSPKAIEQLYREVPTTTSSYERRFHHSEQALLQLLCNPDSIQKIISQLINSPNVTRGAKVDKIILNIASTRYMCPDCELANLGLQNPERSPFLRELTRQLKQQGFALPNKRPLQLLTLVSARIPYPPGVQKKRHDEHGKPHIDLRADRPSTIFARDIESTQIRQASMLSRKPTRT